nr:uncharacterized protein LOC109156792 [Ipomoea trifida]
MKLVHFLAFSLVLVQAAFGELVCEELGVGVCSFSIASSGKRCVLETYASGDGSMKLQCKTSEVGTNMYMREHIETDECIAACGVDRKSLGISSDSLLDHRFTAKLCSPQCYQNCPNIVDLYYNLASEEGVLLPDLCKALRTSSGRAMTSRFLSSGAAFAPASTAAAAAPTSEAAAFAPTSTASQLPVGICSFSIATSGKRCVLETYASGEGTMELQCKTSEVGSNMYMREHIETDECIAACGVDRKSLGISSDSLLDHRFTAKLCSPQCYQNCPNIVDLYYNLASEEGVLLPDLCKALRTISGRAMTSRFLSSGAAFGPAATAAAAPATSEAAFGPISSVDCAPPPM